ncbi:MAG: hypothetical protein ACREP7_17555 [Lysobacter sp.]
MDFDGFSVFFCLLCVVFTQFNYRAARGRLIASDGGRGPTGMVGRRYQRRFAIAAAIPWLTMAYGLIFAGVPSVFAFFKPQVGPPFVTIWLAGMSALFLTFTAWVFLANGAAIAKQFELLAPFGLSPRYQQAMTVHAFKVLAAVAPFFPLLWVLMGFIDP